MMVSVLGVGVKSFWQTVEATMVTVSKNNKMKYLNQVSDRLVLASVSGSHRFARIISGTANDERTPARSDRLLVYFQPRDVHSGQVVSQVGIMVPWKRQRKLIYPLSVVMYADIQPTCLGSKLCTHPLMLRWPYWLIDRPILADRPDRANRRIWPRGALFDSSCTCTVIIKPRRCIQSRFDI